VGIENSFINYPKGQDWGYFALKDTIPDDFIEKLKGLHIIVGGNEIDWSRVKSA
jgi:hypothetical protein